MGGSQSTLDQGRTKLFEKISQDIGSGNEGDMSDMQCTVNQDPSVSLIPVLTKKNYPETSEISMHSMQSTQESILTEEGSSGSIKREDLQSSMKRRGGIKMVENPEEDEIELMFKLME